MVPHVPPPSGSRTGRPELGLPAGKAGLRPRREATARSVKVFSATRSAGGRDLHEPPVRDAREQVVGRLAHPDEELDASPPPSGKSAWGVMRSRAHPSRPVRCSPGRRGEERRRAREDERVAHDVAARVEDADAQLERALSRAHGVRREHDLLRRPGARARRRSSPGSSTSRSGAGSRPAAERGRRAAGSSRWRPGRAPSARRSPSPMPSVLRAVTCKRMPAADVVGGQLVLRTRRAGDRGAVGARSPARRSPGSAATGRRRGAASSPSRARRST